jgi:prevent-host-death family protein
MLSNAEYGAALAEIRRLTFKDPPLSLQDEARLEASRAVVRLCTGHPGSIGKESAMSQDSDEQQPARVSVLSLSRARRDLTSILRRQRDVVVTRRGVPVVVMAPIEGSDVKEPK